jgi:hypothetical protein
MFDGPRVLREVTHGPTVNGVLPVPEGQKEIAPNDATGDGRLTWGCEGPEPRQLPVTARPIQRHEGNQHDVEAGMAGFSTSISSNAGQ